MTNRSSQSRTTANIVVTITRSTAARVGALLAGLLLLVVGHGGRRSGGREAPPVLLMVTGFTASTVVSSRLLSTQRPRRTRVTMTTSLRSTSSRSSSNSKDAQLAKGAAQLYTRTPLLHSAPLSDLVGKPVYLKMDAFQASGSFKVRTTTGRT